MHLPKLKLRVSLVDICFFLLLALAIYLRFYHFDRTYDWNTDNIRDFLVAKHIAKDHDFKWLSPWAAGGQNTLANSVFYYYLLALFYLLTFGNIFVYQLIVAILCMLVTIIYAYRFGKLFFKDKLWQYASALLLCFIPPLNLYGKSVFQPYLVVPFLLVSFYYFAVAYQKKSAKLLSGAVVSYFLALNIHYSTLILLPWIIGMTIYLQYYLFKKRSKRNKFQLRSLLRSQLNYPSLVIVGGFYFLLINQIMIKGFSSSFDYLYVFLHKTFVTNQSLYLENLKQNFNVFATTMLGTSEINCWVFLLYLAIFFTFMLFIFGKKTFYSLSLFVAFLLLPFVYLVVHNNFNFPSNYFVVFYIVLPLFLISVLSAVKKKFCTPLFTTILLSFLFLSINQFNGMKFSSNLGTINKYQVAAKAIAVDAKSHLSESNDFFLFVIDNQIDWSSPAYWFYLEEEFDTELVELTSYRYNVLSSRELSQNIYLICDNPHISWHEGREHWCSELTEGKSIFAERELVLSDAAQQLSIYRLKTVQPISYYIFYKTIYPR